MLKIYRLLKSRLKIYRTETLETLEKEDTLKRGKERKRNLTKTAVSVRYPMISTRLRVIFHRGLIYQVRMRTLLKRSLRLQMIKEL